MELTAKPFGSRIEAQTIALHQHTEIPARKYSKQLQRATTCGVAEGNVPEQCTRKIGQRNGRGLAWLFCKDHLQFKLLTRTLDENGDFVARDPLAQLFTQVKKILE